MDYDYTIYHIKTFHVLIGLNYYEHMPSVHFLNKIEIDAMNVCTVFTFLQTQKYKSPNMDSTDDRLSLCLFWYVSHSQTNTGERKQQSSLKLFLNGIKALQ